MTDVLVGALWHSVPSFSLRFLVATPAAAAAVLFCPSIDERSTGLRHAVPAAYSGGTARKCAPLPGRRLTVWSLGNVGYSAGRSLVSKVSPTGVHGDAVILGVMSILPVMMF